MTKNRKGRAGWHQATPKTSIRSCNSTDHFARINGAIVTLALWGWLPLGLPRWINSKGGLNNE